MSWEDRSELVGKELSVQYKTYELLTRKHFVTTDEN